MTITSVQAKIKKIRVSPFKLNSIAKPIRNKRVQDALVILKGMKKRSAADVYKAVVSAMSNAENNHGLDANRLVITEASVGKDLVLKRLDFKGKSRMGRITKPFSQIRVVVSQF